MDPALPELLARVRFEPRCNAVEGLEVFRSLLRKDSAETLDFLVRRLARLEGEERGGIAFVIAEHAYSTGDLARVRRLFRSRDPVVRRSILNALWDDPGPSARQRAEPLRLAIRGAIDPDEGVRAEACRVFQNQCGWKVDVSSALGPLLMLLSDVDAGVRLLLTQSGTSREDGMTCRLTFSNSVGTLEIETRMFARPPLGH